MFKKKTGKVLAAALCAAVMSGLYAAPAMAAVYQGSDPTGVIPGTQVGQGEDYVIDRNSYNNKDQVIFGTNASGTTDSFLALRYVHANGESGTGNYKFDETFSVHVKTGNVMTKGSITASGSITAANFVGKINNIDIKQQGNDIIVGGVNISQLGAGGGGIISGGDTDFGGGNLTNVTSINGINFKQFVDDTNKAIQDLNNKVQNGGGGSDTTIKGDSNIDVTDKGQNGNHDYELGLNQDGITIGDVKIDGTNGGKVTAGEGSFTNITGDKANIGGVTIENNTVNAETGNFSNDVVVGTGDDKVSLKEVGSKIDDLEQSISGFDSRINEVDDKINKVGAMAAAIANLRTMGYDPTAPTEIAVGVGQYRNETGAALGFFHYPSKDFMLSLSVSTSGEEVMGGIGATWKFGRKSPEAIAKSEAAKAEKAKLAKAEALKKAAEEAKLAQQQKRHAALAVQQAAK